MNGDDDDSGSVGGDGAVCQGVEVYPYIRRERPDEVNLAWMQLNLHSLPTGATIFGRTWFMRKHLLLDFYKQTIACTQPTPPVPFPTSSAASLRC